MGRRTRAIAASIMAALAMVGVVGCGEVTGKASTATSAPQPTVTATATMTAPTATATVAITETDFTCPTTTNGSTKTFSDPQTGLSFSYPAAWTEQQCERDATATSTVGLHIGNMFSIAVMPRTGESIEWYVNANKAPNETITYTPLLHPHAGNIEELSDTIGANPQPDEPFSNVIAVVQGGQDFYIVYGLTAMVNQTDTSPPISHEQLAEQVVTTFSVP